MAATPHFAAVPAGLPTPVNRITFNIGKNLPILLDQADFRQRKPTYGQKNGKN